MNIHPLSPSLGSIIHGFDLSQPLTKSLLADLRAIWLDRQVIILRGQMLSSKQYLAFAKQIGTPDIYPFLKGLEGFPEITPVLKKETETMNFGGVWHSDTTYQACPPMATMLYALELPPVGGDTLFANQVQAYESLSEGLKDTLSTLNIICRPDKAAVMATRADRIAEQGRDTSKDNLVGIHPAIRTHPETGRKALYVNQAHSCNFEGWSMEESDNRCTLHYPVNDYHGHRRLLHRITLKGDKPV